MLRSFPSIPVESRIALLRGRRVLLSPDLALLYGVTTKQLNQQVRRNIRRFPADFMFALTSAEMRNLRSQIVTSSWGGSRYRPLAFTEQGVAMLSSVLNSERAIRVNIRIMRAFLKLRDLLATHEKLARKLNELERKYDGQFSAVFEALRGIIDPPEEPEEKRPRIGFRRTTPGSPDTDSRHRARRA